MESVNVSGLKNNPSDALRRARKEVVVVMNRDKPDALVVGMSLSQFVSHVSRLGDFSLYDEATKGAKLGTFKST